LIEAIFGIVWFISMIISWIGDFFAVHPMISNVLFTIVLLGIRLYLATKIRINSVVTIGFHVIIILSAWLTLRNNLEHRENSMDISSIVMSIMSIIVIIDCIHDIIIADEYYKRKDIGIDPLYMFKGLTSIVTLGYSQVVFFLVTDMVIGVVVKKKIKRALKSGRALPPIDHVEWNFQAARYHYKKQIKRLESRKKIVSNIETIDAENSIGVEKLNKLYPQKLIDKIAEMVGGNEEMKVKRENASMSLLLSGENYAYLDMTVFMKYADMISTVMSNKGCFGVSEIKNFSELDELRLTAPIMFSNTKGPRWAEYFIIQALQPLVSVGIFEDCNLNDNDPLDNHSYRYVKSTRTIPSINANDNPLLALDDDD